MELSLYPQHKLVTVGIWQRKLIVRWGSRWRREVLLLSGCCPRRSCASEEIFGVGGRFESMERMMER